MSVTIQRIAGRPQSKRVTYAASWECFDDSDHLIGYIDDIGDVYPTLVFQPVPMSVGYSSSDLRDMTEAIRLATLARKEEVQNARTHDNPRLTDTIVLSDVPPVFLSR